MRNITNSNCPSACYGSYGKIVKGLLLSMAIVLFNFTQVQAQQTVAVAGKTTTIELSPSVYLGDGNPDGSSMNQMKIGSLSGLRDLVEPLPNPDLAANVDCANLRVVLVLDESGSILNRNGVEQVREATYGLAEVFLNSPAVLTVIEFDSQAREIDLGGSVVTPSFLANLEAYLYGDHIGQSYDPNSNGVNLPCPIGYTNWQDALELTLEANPNLVLFLTDGEPGGYNVDTDVNSCGYIAGGTQAHFDAGIAAAIPAANALKENGAHMFAIGVGDYIYVDNLVLISDDENFGANGNIFTDDYSIGSFADLKDDLTAGLNAICGTEIAVTKTVSPEQICSADQLVTFTITVENTGGVNDFDAAGVSVLDTFPSYFTDLAIVGSPVGAALDGQVLTYEIGNLIPGQTATIMVQALVSGSTGFYSNTALANAVNANKKYATANLELTEILHSYSEVMACDSYTWKGTEYTTSGLYFSDISENDCPRLDSLQLVINQPSFGEETAEACGSYEWNGVTYDISGDHTTVFPGENGQCDSTATLHLTINTAPSHNIYVTTCEMPYTWHFEDYYVSGTYDKVYVGGNGVCDSTVTLHLSIGQLGDPCVDASGAGTINEDCGCTPIDWDCTDLSANIGDACDDGDDFTENDLVNDECECSGTPIVVFDCPELEANIGDSCDDGNDSTEGDILGDDCECAGTPIVVFDCPELEANIGDSCDDGDDSTEGDILGDDCECAGTPIVVFDCPELEANIGDACDDGDDSTEGDILGDDCECAGTPIVVFDCPELEANIGDTCNDGDSTTSGDVIGEDCACAGTPTQVSDDCNNFATYFISHATGILGSDIYKVNFVGSEAVLDFQFDLSYNAHMAINAQAGVAYFIDEAGTGMEVYDLNGNASIVTLALSSGLSHVVAAVYNPTDGLVYIGDMVARKVYTVDPDGTGQLVFYANALVSGGDLAFQNGELYLATKTGNKLYKVVQNGTAVLVGNIPAGVNGLAASSNTTDVVVSNLNSTQITQIDVTDGSVQNTFDVILNDELFTVLNGDLASGCVSNEPVTVEECYGSEIIAFNQGLLTNGNPVPADRSDATKALGEPDRSNAAGGFVSLGVGGSITIAFGGQVIDGPGNDIKIWETSFAGNNCGGPGDERADIELSADGITFIPAGTICLDGEVDMASVGLDYVTQIRITNAATTNTPDGYDVDGVEALHGCGNNPVIEYGDCYATELIEYVLGVKSDASPINANQTDPSQALGMPERATSGYSYTTLGYGGSIILGFNGAVPNGPGNDIEVVETTYGNYPTCASYPESADVYVSVNGIQWFFAKTICKYDGFVDISDAGNFDHINYVKIENNDVLSTTPDAFDVDGVVALHNCNDEVTPQSKFVNVEFSSTLSSYPNPTSGSSNVVFVSGETTHTTIEVYDMNGRNVANLFNQVAQADQAYKLDFNGNNLPNGVYIYKMTTNNETIIEKFMIAR